MEADQYETVLLAYVQAVRDLERISRSDRERYQAAYQRLEEARRAYEQARANYDDPKKTKDG